MEEAGLIRSDVLEDGGGGYKGRSGESVGLDGGNKESLGGRRADSSLHSLFHTPSP